MIPRATYDREAHAVTVELGQEQVCGTVAHPDDEHLVDIGEDGSVVALEILAPDRLMLREIAERFGLLADLAAIESAIARAMAPWTGATSPQITMAQGDVRAGVSRASVAVSASRSTSSQGDLQPA